jgi:3-hydroxyisobutyrate dehydrogenase-like beta-hydroxyacid dehydrogenase
MAKLGFIGLGAMGSQVAARLLAAGHSVTGYNRTRAKAEPLLQAGLLWGDSPRAVAAAADIVFSMVTDDAALQAIAGADETDGLLAGLGPGKIFIDMSTVSPVTSRHLAGQAAQRGAQMLDAPISGSPHSVQQGKASILVGGAIATFDSARRVLLDIAPRVTHLGENGAGLILKLASNLNLAVQMLAFSEGVLLAEKNGIPRQLAVEALLGSALASPMLVYRGPFVLDLPRPAWFEIRMMQKDLQLALETGRTSRVPLPTATVTNELLTAGRGLGLGREDFAALFIVLAKLAGDE